MDETYTLALSLLDFVPNLAFLVGSIFLVRFVILIKHRVCSYSIIAGSILVFLGGTLQATWKLFYTIGAGNYQILRDIQFILMSPGFLLLLIGVVLLLKLEKNVGLVAIAGWKIPLLAIMTISSLGFQGILSYISFRRKVNVAGVMYILAIVCMLGMAGMAGREQTITQQWIEEVTNSVGQIAYASGSLFLFRHAKEESDHN